MKDDDELPNATFESASPSSEPWNTFGKPSDAVLTPELLEKAIERLLQMPHRPPSCSLCLMDYPFHLQNCPVYRLSREEEKNP